MRNFVLIGFLFITVSAFGQKQFSSTRIRVIVDYHYNYGLVEKGDFFKFTRSNADLYGNSLHLSALYNINSKFATGVGVGLDRYEEPGFNTLPLFLTLHYSPFEKIPRGYVYTNAGYALETGDFTPGLLFDIGVGYRKMFKKRHGLNFQFGYNMKQYEGAYMLIDEDYTITTGTDYRYRHSLSFGIGYIF